MYENELQNRIEGVLQEVLVRNAVQVCLRPRLSGEQSCEFLVEVDEVLCVGSPLELVL